MSRFKTRSRSSARAFMVLLLALGQPVSASAATVCVDSVSEFHAAFDDWQDQPLTVNVETGTYDFATPRRFDQGDDLTIVGGWSAGCASRQLDPRLTVFTGVGLEFSGESTRVESRWCTGSAPTWWWRAWRPRKSWKYWPHSGAATRRDT